MQVLAFPEFQHTWVSVVQYVAYKISPMIFIEDKKQQHVAILGTEVMPVFSLTYRCYKSTYINLSFVSVLKLSSGSETCLPFVPDGKQRNKSSNF